MLPLELVMREFEAGKFHEIVVSIIVHHCLNIGFGNRLLDFWPLFGHILPGRLGMAALLQYLS